VTRNSTRNEHGGDSNFEIERASVPLTALIRQSRHQIAGPSLYELAPLDEEAP
jgi:hypothetical protein